VPVDDARFGKAVPCSCADGQRAQSQGSINRLERISHPVPSNMTFDVFDRTWPVSAVDQRSLYEAVYLARHYAVDAEPWCLVLAGSYGCGKTHLGCAIVNWRNLVTNGAGGALFLVVPDLLEHMRAGYDKGGEYSFWDRFEHIRQAPFLILDDYGADRLTAWAEEKMFQILNHRYKLLLPTVILTNAPTASSFADRVASRLAEATYHVITAGDYRKQAALTSPNGHTLEPA